MLAWLAAVLILAQDPPPRKPEKAPQDPSKIASGIPAVEQIIQAAYQNLPLHGQGESDLGGNIARLEARLKQLRERLATVEEALGKEGDPDKKKALQGQAKEVTESMAKAKKELDDYVGGEPWDEADLVPAAWLDFRYERRRNVDLFIPGEDDNLTHFRWGAALKLKLDETCRIVLMGRQTRTWFADEDFRRQQDLFDFDTARVDFRLYNEGIPLQVTAGRDGLVIGDGRMVGIDWWQNATHTFDGVKGFNRTWLGESLHSAHVDTQAFWGRPATVEDGETDDHRLNRSDPDVNLLGVSSAAQTEAGSMLGLYALYDQDGQHLQASDFDFGGRRLITAGLRLKKKIGDHFEFQGEGAWQTGTYAKEDHSAWAMHAQASFQSESGGLLRRLILSGGITLSYDQASGDSDPADGEHGTFIAPYPATHNQLGLADMVGWQNLRAYGINWRVGDSGLSLDLSYHRYFLAEDKDGLYDAHGMMVRRDATGAAGSDVGSEFDLRLVVTVISIGYSRFMAGDFLDTTGGDSDGQLFYIAFGREL